MKITYVEYHVLNKFAGTPGPDVLALRICGITLRTPMRRSAEERSMVVNFKSMQSPAELERECRPLKFCNVFEKKYDTPGSIRHGCAINI